MPAVAAVPAISSRRAVFPALSGSPEQVRWAEEIRDRLIEGLNRAMRSGQGIARAQAAQSTREWLLGHTAASWWIENRNYKPSTVSRARYAEVLDIYGSLLGKRGPRRQVLVDGVDKRKPPVRPL